MIASITADVPRTAVSAISPLFEQLCDSAVNPHKSISHETNHPPAEFDWAIHPGGAAILRGAQRSLNLVDDHIRASLNVYRSHGNSSSPTVLIVLDELRRMGKGRDNVVATSFGPGLTIEMCMMKRCRSTAVTPRLTSSFWNSKQLSRLSLFRVARSVISKQRCSWITSTRAP
jgi:predicted naringenin-chalcone synthase